MSNTVEKRAPAAGFQGAPELVAGLDEAMDAGGVSAITAAVKDVLSTLIRSGGLVLPAACRTTCADHYQRRELYRSGRYGYSVVAMSWGPAQGTALHDHGGLWCVEGVCEGGLEIEQYELADRQGDRFRFEQRGTHMARTGSAGCLIPPYEYHRIGNPSESESAVSLHIYERPMSACHVFEPLGDGWFGRTTRRLELDA